MKEEKHRFERQQKPFVPVENPFPPESKWERRERRTYNSMLALTTIAAVVGPSIDSAGERRRVELKLQQLWEEISPMNAEEKQIVEQLQRVVKGESSLPKSTAKMKMGMEAARGGLTEQEIENAASEYTRRLDEMSGLADSSNPLPLFRAVVDSFGQYEETHSYTTDLLNGEGGNCEARAYYACGMVEDVIPELAPRLSIETLWVENESGELVPHVRCVYVNSDGTITPLEGAIKPEATEELPTQTAQTQLVEAFLLRHGALPPNITIQHAVKSLPSKPDGTKWKVQDTMTDSILLHPIASKIQQYTPGVIDNSPPEGMPVEVFIHHMPQEEWDKIVRDPNHPKRAELFQQHAEDWKPTILRTASDVQRYDRDHYMGPLTPAHIRLATPEARSEFVRNLSEIVTNQLMVVVPEWADQEYGQLFIEHMIAMHEIQDIMVMIDSQHAETILSQYFRFLLSDDPRAYILQNDHQGTFHLRNIEQISADFLTVQVFGTYVIDINSEKTLHRLTQTDFLEQYLQAASQHTDVFYGKSLVIATHRSSDGYAIDEILQELKKKWGDSVYELITISYSRASIIITAEEFDFLLDEQANYANLLDQQRHSILEGKVLLSDEASMKFMELFEKEISKRQHIGVNGGSSPEAVARIARAFFKKPPINGELKQLAIRSVRSDLYLRAISDAGVQAALDAYPDARKASIRVYISPTSSLTIDEFMNRIPNGMRGRLIQQISSDDE